MSTPGPDAWSNLDAVYTLYDPCGVDLPDAALVGLDSMIGLMELFNVSYAQQASMNAPLPCTSDTLNRLADWFTEAGYQHGTYIAFSRRGCPSRHRRTLWINADPAGALSTIGYSLILRSAWLNHDPIRLVGASRLQDQFLHAPVQQLSHVEHVLRWTRHRMDPAELF